MSTWSAIEHALRERLLPPRACVALETFRRLIEDARAMLAPGFADELSQDRWLPRGRSFGTESVEADSGEPEDISFDDFGESGAGGRGSAC